MRQTLALFKLTIALSCLIGISTKAENIDPNTDAVEAKVWLRKIQSAAQGLNYSGTFVYQQATQMRTSRITHILNGKNEIEKLEILDGQAREYIRNNEEIISFIPKTKSMFLEKRITKEIFPSILATNSLDLADNYKIKKVEMGRVAGHECQALVLAPKDLFRYGYKLWAEKKTGLLLRAQVLNEKDEVVEQIAFTDLVIGGIDRNRVKPSFANLSGWHTENAVMSPAYRTGWLVKWVPPGFKKTHEIKRLVTTPDTALHSAKSANVSPNGSSPAQREVLQIVFSDGLAAISIFIEPGTQSRTEGSMQQGAMNLIGKRQGEFWLIIVGEVPFSAIKQVANSIEYKPQ